jgi:hypothetical protein
VAFDVTNRGGTDSDPQTVTVTAPAGVAVTAAGASSHAAGPHLRRPHLRGPGGARAPAAPTTGQSGRTAGPDDTAVSCSGTACHYTVPARTRLTITLTLGVALDARSGKLGLSLPDARLVWIPVTVDRLGSGASAPTGKSTAGDTATATRDGRTAGATDSGTH